MNLNPDGLLKKRLRAIRDKLDFLKHQGASPNKKSFSEYSDSHYWGSYRFQIPEIIVGKKDIVEFAS